MSQESNVTTGASLVAGTGGWTIGHVMSADWLQILSAVFIVLTFAVQFYYKRRQNKRDQAREDRDQARDERERRL